MTLSKTLPYLSFHLHHHDHPLFLTAILLPSSPLPNLSLCLTTLSQSWPPNFLFLLQFVIFLSVEHPVPPDVTEDPQNITETNLLSTFNLTCLASENPLYQWYRDGNLIYNDTKPILTITEALPEDRGYYTCVAVNEAGTSSSQPGLVVIPGKT